MNLASPAPEAAALIVTFFGVLKLSGVNVSDSPSATLSPRFPEDHNVLTVTSLDGAAGSEIPTVPLALPVSSARGSPRSDRDNTARSRQ